MPNERNTPDNLTVCLLIIFLPGIFIELNSINPPAQKFPLTLTLPKCISFLRIGDKVNVVISKVFRVVDYKS